MADPFDVFKAFFNQRFGKSLAVKGNPGTGKTTFCLELASQMIGIQPVMYLSSRFTDEPLKDQFPFIEEVSYRFDPAKYAAHKTLKYVNTDHLEKLEKSMEEKTSMGRIVFDISEVLPELNSIYKFVDKNIDLGPIVILDSIEALAEKYGMEADYLFSVLQNDIVEKSGAGIIMVLESTGNERLEYYCDGVISLKSEPIANYITRSMKIEKLRGLSIGSIPVFSHSLLNGRFNLFPHLDVQYPKVQVPMEKSEEPTFNFINIGDGELAKILPENSASIEIGSVIMIHKTQVSDMTGLANSLIKNTMIRRALANGHGVLDATSGSYETAKLLNLTTEPEYRSRYVRADTSENGDNTTKLTQVGKSIRADFSMENIQKVMGDSGNTNMYFFSTDLLNFIYVEGFIGEFLHVINDLRNNGVIVLVTEDQTYRKLGHFSNTTIHILDLDGMVFTNTGRNEQYGVEVVNEPGKWPSIKLIEVV